MSALVEYVPLVETLLVRLIIFDSSLTGDLLEPDASLVAREMTLEPLVFAVLTLLLLPLHGTVTVTVTAEQLLFGPAFEDVEVVTDTVFTLVAVIVVVPVPVPEIPSLPVVELVDTVAELVMPVDTAFVGAFNVSPTNSTSQFTPGLAF